MLRRSTITAAALLAFGAVAQAASPLYGTMVLAGTETCRIAANFDSQFRPTGPVVRSEQAMAGYVLFAANGEGLFVLMRGAEVSDVDASSSKLSYYFQQVDINDGTNEKYFKMSLIPGTFQRHFDSGPRTGQTEWRDVSTSDGYFFKDRKKIVLEGGPEIQARTYSNGDARKAVCSWSVSGDFVPTK